MKKILVIIGIAILSASCSKKNTSANPGPVITLSTPSDNQVFTVGQTVTITAAITDQDNIQQTQIHVENKSTGAIVLHQETHPASVSSMITGSFIAAAGITYKVEVEAIDVAAIESKVEITVTGK